MVLSDYKFLFNKQQVNQKIRYFEIINIDRQVRLYKPESPRSCMVNNTKTLSR